MPLSLEVLEVPGSFEAPLSLDVRVLVLEALPMEVRVPELAQVLIPVRLPVLAQVLA